MSERPDQSILQTVFPPKVVSADEIDGIPPEVGLYRQHFGGSAWTEVNERYYKWHNDAFTLMDHQTLKYFIAGFLDVILDDPNSSPCEFLVYFAGSQSFVDFCSVLTDEQTEFLIAVIDWAIRDEYFGEDNRERYAVMRSRLKTT